MLLGHQTNKDNILPQLLMDLPNKGLNQFLLIRQIIFSNLDNILQQNNSSTAT
jgi:hypothetical protein